MGFLLGAVGVSVGLGSIWRFPYLTGVGGGFAFILVFVLACLVFGAPVLVGEAIIGRWARRSPPCAAGEIAARLGHSRAWNVVGWIGSLAGLLIVSYYTMIAGWVMAYAWAFAVGDYPRGATEAARHFQRLVGDTTTVTLWQAGFLLLVVLASARGLARGVEWANRWRAPVLLVLLLGLVGYAWCTGDVARGLRFAFAPDFSRLTPTVLLDAVGQALFALGVSAGMLLAYGAYTPAGESLARSVWAVVGSIVTVSLLATAVIFPLVFRYGMNPAQGPELVFQVLPVAFAEMPGGRGFGSLFFALLVLAAFTPTIGLLEAWTYYLTERTGLTRRWALALEAAACLALGQVSVQSFGHWSAWHPLAGIKRFANMNAFAAVDFLASNVLMPLSALLVTVFLGWRLAGRIPGEEWTGMSPRTVRWLQFSMRYLCPVGIVVVLVTGLGV